MTANALRDVSSKTSIVTPIASKLSEAVLPLMQYVGIQKLDVKISESANLRKIDAMIECFEKTPDNMVAFAMLIKDSLAEIIASFGITHLEIIADPNEKDMLLEGYDQLDAMYKAALISSADSEAKDTPVQKKKRKTRACTTVAKKCACRSKSCATKNNR